MTPYHSQQRGGSNIRNGRENRGNFRGAGARHIPNSNDRNLSFQNQQFLTPNWQQSPVIVDSSMGSSSSSSPSFNPMTPINGIEVTVQDIQPFSSQHDHVDNLLLRTATPVNQVQDDRRATSGATTPFSQASTVRETTPPLNDGTNRHDDGTYSDGVPSRDTSIAPRTTVSDIRHDRRPSV